MPLKSLPRHHVNVGPLDALRAACGLLGGDDPESVAALERRFASLIGTKHAVAVGSARTGFHHLLRALGVEGREVVLPAFTFWGMGNVVAMAKGTPVLADVDPGTTNVTAATVRPALSERTRAVVPTHLFGGPAPMDELSELAEERGLAVIEDCAQANGASLRDRRVGSLGTAAVFSFNVYKHMTGFGGGMVTTNDGELAGRVRELESAWPLPGRGALAAKVALGAAMGLATRPWVYSLALYPPMRALSALRGGAAPGAVVSHDEQLQPSMPSHFAVRMASLQARTALSQLDRLDVGCDARIRNAAVLTEGLRGVEGVSVPEAVEGARHIYYHYVVKARERERLVRALFREGVDAKVSIGDDCSAHPALRPWRRACPESSRAAAEGLALPVWPTLGEQDMERVATAVRRALGRG